MTDLTGLLRSAASIHRRRGPLGSRRADSDAAETGVPHEEGGDPACWAHLVENDHTETPR